LSWLTPAKNVRLHLLDGSPSFEGIYVGTKAGHYRILNAGIVESEDVTVKMDGEAWVPQERVLFMQVLS
jgi:hypothetical protein